LVLTLLSLVALIKWEFPYSCISLGEYNSWSWQRQRFEKSKLEDIILTPCVADSSTLLGSQEGLGEAA
jgi:hypothetical protein